MTTQKQTLLQRIFYDSSGKVVLGQFPNAPLALWLAFSLTRLFALPVNIEAGLSALASAFLFVWAYLEITSGVSYFRRFLGATVMAFIIAGYFS